MDTATTAETLATGASPVQIIILVILGCLLMWAIFRFVQWMIDVKVGELPTDMKETRSEVSNITKKLTQIEGKLWSSEEIEREMNSCIYKHAETCPARHRGDK